MPQLHWLTRETDLKAADQVPYRLLEEVPDLSCAERDPTTENMLIQGDNLEALKALLPIYAGQVKCIFIDPPYNTRSAFEHYDDNLEHSKWLAMMVPRLTLLRDFLREDGSIWVTIDDNEAHYLKVVMDEVFGRKNFVANVVWEKKYSPQNNALWLSDSHDHTLIFARNKEIWRPIPLPRTQEMNDRYKNPDNDFRGVWKAADFTISLTGGQRGAQYARTGESENLYDITLPSGRIVRPSAGRCWVATPAKFEELKADNRVWFGLSGNNMPALKTFLSSIENDGVVAKTIWFRSEAGDNESAKKEAQAFGMDTMFSTPKPEKLLARILSLSTESDDLILDSFLGSGTTAAVAQKMGRRYIGIEMGDHAETHCAPRLRKVIDGEQGGISEAVNWQGGGGFRFYRLGPTIFGADGQIDERIRFPQLAAHVWFTETKTPRKLRRGEARSPLLGVHNNTAYYLLYNGILSDRHPHSGNVLTRAILADLPPHDGQRVIYGASSRLSAATLKRLGITFKQTPYDVKAD